MLVAEYDYSTTTIVPIRTRHLQLLVYSPMMVVKYEVIVDYLFNDLLCEYSRRHVRKCTVGGCTSALDTCKT